jgi:hypothetical protein
MLRYNEQAVAANGKRQDPSRVAIEALRRQRPIEDLLHNRRHWLHADIGDLVLW